MMGRIRSVAPVLFVFAALFLAMAPRGDPTGPESRPAESPPAQITEFPRSLTLAETEALQAANDFGLDLFRRLYEEGEEDRANVFISPLSASMSLGMMLNGVGGETFDAMGDALGLNGLMVAEANGAYKDLTDLLLRLDPSVEFRLANRSWLEEGFRIRRDYRSRVREAFVGTVSDPTS